VVGKHLSSIQKPLFYVYNEEKSQRFFSQCKVQSDSLMTGLSPHIPDIDRSIVDAENSKLLHYGFEMGNITISAKLINEIRFPSVLALPQSYLQHLFR